MTHVFYFQFLSINHYFCTLLHFCKSYMYLLRNESCNNHANSISFHIKERCLASVSKGFSEPSKHFSLLVARKFRKKFHLSPSPQFWRRQKAKMLQTPECLLSRLKVLLNNMFSVNFINVFSNIHPQSLISNRGVPRHFLVVRTKPVFY